MTKKRKDEPTAMEEGKFLKKIRKKKKKGKELREINTLSDLLH